MKSILASVVAVALLGTSAAAMAQPNGGFRGDRGVMDNRGRDWDGRRDFDRPGVNHRFDDHRRGNDRYFAPRWRPGMFVRDHRRFVVNDWGHYHLRRPPRGYYWVRQNNDFLMVAIATGLVVDVLLSNSYGPYDYGPYGYGPGGYGYYYGR